MYKYKFLNILDSMNEKEFKMLGKFINSPYFNESRKIKELYDFIKIYYHNHSFDKITTEQISNKIFSGEKQNNARTRKLISDFNMHIEKFLMHNSLENDTIGKKAYLSKQLKAKELDKFYNVELDDLKKLLNSSGWDSKSYYFSRLKLIDEELYIKTNELHTEKKIKTILDLIDSIDYLNIFVRLYVYHILVQNNLQREERIIEYGFIDLKKFLETLENKIETFHSDEPRIYLYYITLKLIISKSTDKIYPELENYIEKNRAALNSADIEFSIYTIVNYLVNEMSGGKYENINIAVEVMKRIDEKGFFENINSIKHFTFIQIITFAIYIKDLEYAESFLWKYFSKVKVYKEDSMNLALASLRLAQGRYSEASDHLDMINYETYGFYLMANGLRLRIHYEVNSLKFINPIVDSFKHYLKRNNHIPQVFKESFSMFLNYIMKLTSLKKKSRKDIFKFEYELSNERNFYGKKWLEEKVNELVISG